MTARSPGPSSGSFGTQARREQINEFQAAYRQARRNAFSQSIARLQQASSTAVTALLKVMVDPATPASARVRATDIVLSQASNAIELDEIEARLTELEQATANR